MQKCPEQSVTWGILRCKACKFVLIASLSITISSGRTSVKQHLEELGGCSNSDGSIAGGLGKVEKIKEGEEVYKYQNVGYSM